MPEYLSPGVYMEEIDSGPRPIEGVSTSTVAFVGFTEKAVKDSTNGAISLRNKPQLITSLEQYTRHFGGIVEGAFLPYAVHGFFHNGGQRCYVISVQEMPKAKKQLLNNKLLITAKHAGLSGQRLQVKFDTQDIAQTTKEAEKAQQEAEKARAEAEKATAAVDKAKDEKAKTEAQQKADEAWHDAKEAEAKAKVLEEEATPRFNVSVRRLEENGEWTILEDLEGLTLEEVVEEEKGVKKTKVAYKHNRASQWIDINISDTKLNLATLPQAWTPLELEARQLPAPDPGTLKGEVPKRTGLGALEALDDVSIVCVPDLMAPTSGQDKPDFKVVQTVHDAMVNHCERMTDRVAILDPPPGLSPQEILEWRRDYVPDSSYATLYYPWLETEDPLTKQSIYVPPSGHMAGIWARNDSERGVHKAPANEQVRYTNGLAINVTKGEQDLLNPRGINCIRTFPNRGIRVWGARTVSSDPAWRYLNIRRLFNYVEKSIEQDTQWVVFEPNDPDLWARVTRDVKAFLRMVWRSGALFGLTEDEAFYVKCNEENNPPESRNLGRLYIDVALAPVRPAEFVIFRITQKNEYGGE